MSDKEWRTIHGCPPPALKCRESATTSPASVHSSASTSTRIPASRAAEAVEGPMHPMTAPAVSKRNSANRAADDGLQNRIASTPSRTVPSTDSGGVRDTV